MSKNKKLIPELRFPEFKNDGEWEEYSLGEVLIKNSAKNRSLKYSLVQSVSNKYGFINQDEYFDNRIIASKDTSNYYIIKKGYFAYNPSRIDVGSLAYKQDDEVSIISPLYVSFKANNEIAVDLFLLNWFFSENFKKQMIFEGGVRNTLNYENLEQIKIALPSVKEQQKIASFLTSLDEIVNVQNEKLDLLKDHKKGLMQNLFPQEGEKVPKFRFKEFKQNRDWQKIIFNQAFERITRKNIQNHQNVLTISAQQGLISQEQYFNKKIASKDITNYYLIKKGEFAYNKSYSNEYPKGAIKLLKKYDLGVVSTLYICFKCKEGFSCEYFEHFFESGIFNEQIDKIAQEGARDHGLLNVSVIDFFDSLEVMQPPTKEEQQKIVSCLSALDELILAQAEKLEKLKQHKTGLMQSLFPKMND